MIINPKFQYKVVDRVTNEDGSRFYTCPVTTAPLPSVTTVLSATADKSGLILWEEAVGKAKAEKVRNEACNIGTLMHTNLENHIQGIPQVAGGHPIRMQAARMAAVIIEKGFPKINEVYGMEVAMYYPGLVAGMTDLVGVHEKEEAIMDHKTTKKMKTADMIEDYFCQAATYGFCHDEVHGTKIRKAVIFMVSRTLEYKEFVLDGLQMALYRDKFLYRYDAYLKANP